VTLGVRAEDADMIYTVSDTGIGIAEEHRGRIFEPFFQVEMSKARRVAGTGLGLSVTRHLAALLGGDITLCEQNGDGGSTFEVRIPRYFVAAEEASMEPVAGERVVISEAGAARRGVALPQS